MAVPALQFPDIGGNIMRQYAAGREQARADRFNALAGQALAATPQQRDAFIQQAVALDPQAGFELSKRLEADTDQRRTTLYNMARGWKQLHAQNPAAAQAFFTRQIAPGLKNAGFDLGDYGYNEQEVGSVVDQILAFNPSDAENSVQSTQILRNGNIGIVTRDGRVVDTGQAAAPQTQLISQPGQTPFFAVSGRGQIGQTIGIGEQPQGDAPAQAGPSGLFASLTEAVPGLRITSGARTPEQNAAAGGVPNSFHLTGQAIDIGTPTPQQRAGINAWAAQNGYEVIDNYQDGHVHLEPRGSAPSARQAAPSGPMPVRNPTKAEEAAESTTGRITAERELQRPQDIAKDEQAFRKELDAKLDEPRTVLTAYERVKAAAQAPSAANDLALIFGYMKMLDPGSVVREGEFANAQNTGGIPDRIWNAYNRALNGERLNQAQRQEFVGSANQQAEIARNKVNSEIKRAQSIARQYGYDAERSTGSPDFSGVQSEVQTAAPRQQVPQPRGIPRPQTQAEYDRLPSGALFIDPDDGKTYRK